MPRWRMQPFHTHALEWWLVVGAKITGTLGGFSGGTPTGNLQGWPQLLLGYSPLSHPITDSYISPAKLVENQLIDGSTLNFSREQR